MVGSALLSPATAAVLLATPEEKLLSSDAPPSAGEPSWGAVERRGSSSSGAGGFPLTGPAGPVKHDGRFRTTTIT